MKTMLFLFLFLPFAVLSQNKDYDIAFQKSIPDSAGRPIHMPVRDYPSYLPFDESVRRENAGMMYIIQSDSVYRKFFHQYTYTADSMKKYSHLKKESPWLYNWFEKHHIDSLPIINFSKNELLVYANCPQCLAVCGGEKGLGPCHRNVCMSREAWFIREINSWTTVQLVARKNIADFLIGESSIDTLPGRNRKWVNLPNVFRHELIKLFTPVNQSSFRFVIDTDSLYHKIFSKYPKNSLPVFDFTKQQLVVGFSCHYCVAAGLQNGRPRHRNSCTYKSSWTVRDKLLVKEGQYP